MTTKSDAPLERVIVKKVIDKLNKLKKVRAIKVHGGGFGSGGQPDVTGCIMTDGIGWRFDLEGKRPGQKPTERQKKEMERWGACGSIVGVFTCWEDVVEIFRRRGVYLEERAERESGDA